MRSDDYERGHYVATQRAINRQELGLPLDRSATDEELRQLRVDGWNRADRQLSRPPQEGG